MKNKREGMLCDIYERWLAKPENSNVPKLSADEAMAEVMEDRWRLDQAIHNGGASIECYAEHLRIIDAQLKWLDRFIIVWEKHEAIW